MRDPILHIKLSDLEKIVKETGGKEGYALELLRAAVDKRYQIRDMYTVKVSNSKAKKKVERTIAAEDGRVEIFNRLLSIERKERNPNSPPNPILKDSKDYILLKEIASMAHKFSEDWGFGSIESGYMSFIKIGMDIIGKKYALNKFKFHYSKIYDVMECVKVITEDSDKEGTEKMYNIWKKYLATYSSNIYETKDTLDYINMVYARQEADIEGADYDDWIAAQFEGLSFLKSVPELYQLYGQNAKKRYQSYMTSKGKKTSGRSSTQKSVFKSKVEEIYYEKLRKKRANNENNH